MSTGGRQYRHNHYVPEWYQRRFMHPGQRTYHYLDLAPEQCERAGRRWTRRALLPWGPPRCFAQDDLYTTRWGAITNVEIERFFFGKIDSAAESALTYWAKFDFKRFNNDAFQTY